MHATQDTEANQVPDELLQPTAEQLAHRRMLAERVRRDYEEMYQEKRHDGSEL